MQAIVQVVRDIVSFSPLFGQQINLLLHPSQNVVDNPIYLCDLVATIVQSAETEDLQNMMQEANVRFGRSSPAPIAAFRFNAGWISHSKCWRRRRRWPS